MTSARWELARTYRQEKNVMCYTTGCKTRLNLQILMNICDLKYKESDRGSS